MWPYSMCRGQVLQAVLHPHRGFWGSVARERDPLSPVIRLQDMHVHVFTLTVFKWLPGGQEGVTSEHRPRDCATISCSIILQIE